MPQPRDVKFAISTLTPLSESVELPRIAHLNAHYLYGILVLPEVLLPNALIVLKTIRPAQRLTALPLLVSPNAEFSENQPPSASNAQLPMKLRMLHRLLAQLPSHLLPSQLTVNTLLPRVALSGPVFSAIPDST